MVISEAQTRANSKYRYNPENYDKIKELDLSYKKYLYASSEEYREKKKEYGRAYYYKMLKKKEEESGN
jgi:hypothetical protein